MRHFLAFAAIVTVFSVFVLMLATPLRGVSDCADDRMTDPDGECEHGITDTNAKVMPYRPKGNARVPADAMTYYERMQYNDDYRLCRIIASFEGNPNNPLEIKIPCFRDVARRGEAYSRVSDFDFSVELMRRYWKRYGCTDVESKVRVHRSGSVGRNNKAADDRWIAVRKVWYGKQSAYAAK